MKSYVKYMLAKRAFSIALGLTGKCLSGRDVTSVSIEESYKGDLNFPTNAKELMGQRSSSYKLKGPFEIEWIK